MQPDDHKSEPLTSSTHPGDEDIDVSRRKFAKTGGLAAAVLMTVANRPVMAGGSTGGGTTGKNDQRCTISAWMSAGSGGQVKMSCGGKSCSYWCGQYNVNNYYCWPRPHFSKGGCDGIGYPTQWPGWSYGADCTPTYYSVCGSNPPTTVKDSHGKTITNPSLCQVLNYDKQGSTLQSQFCAALLNAADATCNYGYSVTDVITLYQKNYKTNPTGLYNTFKTLNSRG